MDANELRRRLRQLRDLPRPPEAPHGDLEGFEPVLLGSAVGDCWVCEQPITVSPNVDAWTYRYSDGRVLRFHQACWGLLDEEIRRRRLGGSRER